jgi:hypothetical protein
MSCAHRDGVGICVECEVPVLARNHYYNGKLLVARDFEEEQRFFIGKHRRHVQQLHGRGTACGLKVVEHPQDACRDRWVIVQSGTAIDCCGREIVVTEPVPFDFLSAVQAEWERTHGAGSQMDDQPHTLQVCIGYQECATEEVPVLFDDGGCDDGQCQPNRILESFGLRARIDLQEDSADPLDPRLTWAFTINLARAGWVRRHEATGRIYVLAQPAGGVPTLYGFTTDTATLVDSHTLTGTATDLAISVDGKQAYVALTGEVRQLDLTTAGYPELGTISLNPAQSSPLRLATNPLGWLFVVATANGQLSVYGLPGAATASIDTNVDTITAIDLSLDGQTVNLANDTKTITSVDLTQSTPSPTPIDTGTLDAHAVHVFRGGGRDYLAVGGPGAVELLGPGASKEAWVATAYDPVAIVSSPAGDWLYVLERDKTTGKGYVQAISVALAAALGPVPVGEHPNSIALSADGTTLYAAYLGDANVATTGGVAVLDVAELACDRIWEKALAPCHTCTGDDCIVLATIAGYRHGDKVAQAGIDNLKDRPILASTELITEAVRCLLEGDRAPAPSNPPPTPPPAQASPPLVHICGVNWRHDDTNSFDSLVVKDLQGNPELVLLVMFDNPIEVPGKLTLRLAIAVQTPDPATVPGTIWVDLNGTPDLVALTAANSSPTTGVCTGLTVGGGQINGLRWRFGGLAFAQRITHELPLRVMVQGDFILGTATNPDGNAATLPVDGNHLAPFLSGGNGGRVSGDGTPGGLFQSWMILEPSQAGASAFKGGSQ